MSREGGSVKENKEEIMNLIVKMVFGSHLYGTNTPESDKDFKGVFMPTKEQIYLGKIPKCYSEQTGDDKSKNTKEDTDTEIYSLHYFIKLACEGQTVALDMLHAPWDKLIYSTPLWYEIVGNREKFYTKSMSAFVGYARRQAAKYGIKGSRLNAANKVTDFVHYSLDDVKTKLSQVWDILPEGEHIHKDKLDPNGLKIYEVCGKKVQETVTLEYLYDIMVKFYNAYGERARQAERNEGIDWKAVSHAIRAAMQCKQIFINGTIEYPLPGAKLLKKIKAGELDYTTKVAPLLERLMTEVENLSKNSNLPEKVDRKFWDDFIIEEVEAELYANGNYDLL